MEILRKIKKAFVEAEAQSGASASAALPTLEEIHDKIIKAKLKFRQAVSEAEAASNKSQALYMKLWDVSPAERARLRKQKAELDETVKRKMIQAQGFAKSEATLQDVEIVMQIDQAFAQCGLVDGNEERATSLEDIQKSLAEASLVITKTLESVEKMGMAISVPEVRESALSAEEREREELWRRYDSETDPVKKAEIKRTLEEKEATPQIAMA